jgi:transcriptional regulator with XRE-family HTH domain
MESKFSIKTHFIGSKIKHLRKSNKMTLEDLSIRCYQIDSKSSPSVSYLSLIENGQRNPSKVLLESICTIFQKDVEWFYDQNINKGIDSIFKDANTTFNFEPNFLFSKSILEKAIPRLLTQTGTTGRQFAHILIRSYQEKNFNQFNYIEKEAEFLGKKQFPLSVNDIYDLCKKNNLKIKWFEKEAFNTKDDSNQDIKSLFRSFYNKEDSTIYINSKMINDSSRVKYDLSTYLAHKVLHGGDGVVSSHVTGGKIGSSPKPFEKSTSSLNQKDILYAWRDFECSFFAGALLCPKMKFRRAMNREQYNIMAYEKLNLTPAVLMRRFTAISPYKSWHYFDVYMPGFLRTMYRGNNIPIPLNVSKSPNKLQGKWGVFKNIKSLKINKPQSDLSIMEENSKVYLFCSVSIKTKDAAGNPHIICTGICLNDALSMQDYNSNEILNEIYSYCLKSNRLAMLKSKYKKIITQIGIILNISWIIKSVDRPIDIIDESSSTFKKQEDRSNRKKISWTSQIKKEILTKKQNL